MPESIDMVEDVLDFHRAIDAMDHVGRMPSLPNKDVIDLKCELIAEELDELEDAVANEDVVAVADACADLIYVVIGLALAYGVDLRVVWREVHRSNMAKLGGRKRADGKHLKPEGWAPPDIAGVLERQLPL